MKMCLFLLTCRDKKEADAITQQLLEKKLVACVKQMPITSSFLWKGTIAKSEEVFLVMESIEGNFTAVEKKVRALHSYETFVLNAIPVANASSGVVEWIQETITNE